MRTDIVETSISGGRRASSDAMKVYHPTLAAGRWKTLTFCERMGNVGSEISRAARASTGERRLHAFERALELLDLTIALERGCRQRELLRVRECLVNLFFDRDAYGSTWESLMRYFDVFALTARRHL
ncbi:MAG: hypothetical protein AAB570_00800 [Patescibacteria group bacterium]